MDIGTIANQILVVFLLILVGVYAKKMGIINNESNKGLSSLLLNITLPLYIITSFNLKYSPELLKNLLVIFFFGLTIHPMNYIVGKLLFCKYSSSRRDTMIFCSVFSNCGFMAFPILEGLYGKMGIFYGSVFLAPFNLYLWSMGVRLYNNNTKGFKLKNILNPGILAILGGLIIFIFSIPLPTSIKKTAEAVGSMTTPISMIITGVILADVKLNTLLKDKSLYYVSFMKLIGTPALAIIIMFMLRADTLISGLSILLAAMPTAAMASVFAEQYQKDKEYSSKAVFITTALSLISLPLIILIINLL